MTDFFEFPLGTKSSFHLGGFFDYTWYGSLIISYSQWNIRELFQSKIRQFPQLAHKTRQPHILPSHTCRSSHSSWISSHFLGKLRIPNISLYPIFHWRNRREAISPGRLALRTCFLLFPWGSSWKCFSVSLYIIRFLTILLQNVQVRANLQEVFHIPYHVGEIWA